MPPILHSSQMKLRKGYKTLLKEADTQLLAQQNQSLSLKLVYSFVTGAIDSALDSVQSKVFSNWFFASY